MKKKAVIIIGLVIVVFIAHFVMGADDKGDVEKVIKASYFNGAFNDLDTQSMRKGFHADFAIFSAKGNAIGKYPIDTWIKGIEKGKEDPNFDASRAKMDCRIVSLDITGGCAAAKIEISKDGKKVYTDYLSLLKFDEGWKIAAKVYHAHPKNKSIIFKTPTNRESDVLDSLFIFGGRTVTRNSGPTPRFGGRG